MAIYRLNLSMIKRSEGRSVVAAAAYRAGERLHDERTGKIHDYRNKRDVHHKEIMVEGEAEPWVFNREAMWNSIEKIERQRNSQLARELQLAIPRELRREDQIELVRTFVRDEFVSKGMIADICIHESTASDGGTNPHAHVLLTLRELTEDGTKFKSAKNRQWNIDLTTGGKAYGENDELGGFCNKADSRHGSVEANRKGLEGLRARWNIAANDALERAGSNERIDHRSYRDRGINREPQPKMGLALKVNKPKEAAKGKLRDLAAVKHRNVVRIGLNNNITRKSANDYEENRIKRANQRAPNSSKPIAQARTHERMIREIYGKDFER